MKKIIAAIICFAILSIIVPVYAASTSYFYDGKWHNYNLAPISLQIAGENVQCDVPPLLFNNSTIVPARTIFEKLGAKVAWDATKSQVSISMGNISVMLKINDLNATVNGKNYKMLIAPKIVNNSTMIPVRFVAEAIGIRVDWDSLNRIVEIANTDINVTNIQGGITGSLYRITVSSDTEIKDYTTTEINDYPRLAVDIKNATLKWSSSEMPADSNYVYKVRAAQNSKNPDIVRVVADMKGWTSYNVTLSSDKKQMYIDFGNNPESVDSVKFASSGNTDSIDVAMKYKRQPVISDVNGSTQIAVDIPLSRLGNIPGNIPTNGNVLKSIQCSQLDASTSRLIMNVTGMNVIQENESNDGISINLAPIANKNISYENIDHPKFVIKNENIGMNFFNYKYSTDQNKCTLTTPSNITDIIAGEIFVNDSSIDKIDINPDGGGAGTDIVINGKANCNYKVNSINDNSEITIEAFSSAVTPDYSINPQILNKTVVIDPGHGGSETGAVSNGILEKDLNLAIGLKLDTLLKNSGIKVLMTRQDDRYVDLDTRADFANKANASLFVSVHNNAGDSADNGTMTLFYPTVYDAVYNMSAERAAQITEEEITKGLGTKNDGLWKRPRLAVLCGTKMPAILAEVAYETNDSERQKLLTDSFKQKAAQALYNAIIRILNEMVVNQNSNTSNPYIYNQAVSVPADNPKPEDSQQRNINGFIVPPKVSGKCDYGGASQSEPSMFDLSIQLDYGKELSKTASLDLQRAEAKQVLLSKLDADTVNKIMSVLSQFTGYDVDLWEGEDGELSNSNYTVWVRSLRYSGKATILLLHK